VTSPGVLICVYFVRRLLYLPGLAGVAVMILRAMLRSGRQHAAAYHARAAASFVAFGSSLAADAQAGRHREQLGGAVKTYRLRRNLKSFFYLWGGPVLMLATAAFALVWVLSGAALSHPEVHIGPPRAWVIWLVVLPWIYYFFNGRIVRELRLMPDGSVGIIAPLYRRTVGSDSFEFLGPAFTKNFLELRYAGGRSILLDNMDDIEGFESAIKEHSPTFRGRQWPNA
jgi:hypothetical protein